MVFEETVCNGSKNDNEIKTQAENYTHQTLWFPNLGKRFYKSITLNTKTEYLNVAFQKINLNYQVHLKQCFFLLLLVKALKIKNWMPFY